MIPQNEPLKKKKKRKKKKENRTSIARLTEQDNNYAVVNGRDASAFTGDFT